MLEKSAKTYLVAYFSLTAEISSRELATLV
jgi:hypothetical protein